MSKKIIFATLMVSLPLILNAKVLTVTGIYIGSECGDMCYMSFKTKKGDISPIGYEEEFPKIKKGKQYTITYEEKMEYIEEAGSEIEIQIIKSIK